MKNQVVPMELTDIFEKTFTLVGKTCVRNLIIAFLFLAIPLLLMAIAADDLYSSISDIQDTLQHAQGGFNFDTIMSLLGTLSFFGAATLLVTLGALLAEIAISIVVSEEFMSRTISFTDAIGETFSGKWLHGIGQVLLKGIIFIGGIIIVGIGAAVLAAISTALVTLLLFLALIVLLPFAIYVVLKWYFALTAVAVDDLTVVDSLRESWHLVSGYWWRTLGILILFSLITQLIITIVSLPITFGSMWDVYKDYFTMLGKTGGNIDPTALKKFETAFGPSVSIGTGVNALLNLLISPVYTVVMYLDLRARSSATTESSPAPLLQNPSSEPLDFDQIS